MRFIQMDILLIFISFPKVSAINRHRYPDCEDVCDGVKEVEPSDHLEYRDAI